MSGWRLYDFIWSIDADLAGLRCSRSIYLSCGEDATVDRSLSGPKQPWLDLRLSRSIYLHAHAEEIPHSQLRNVVGNVPVSPSETTNT